MYIGYYEYKKILSWMDDEIKKAEKHFSDVCRENGGIFKPMNSKTRAAAARLRYLRDTKHKIIYDF